LRASAKVFICVQPPGLEGAKWIDDDQCALDPILTGQGCTGNKRNYAFGDIGRGLLTRRWSRYKRETRSLVASNETGHASKLGQSANDRGNLAFALQKDD
jgi:hypothetical protein